MSVHLAIKNLFGLEIKEKMKLSDRETSLVTKKEDTYVLKKKGKINDILNEMTILHHLYSNRIYVHMPLMNKYGEFIITHEEENYCIYDFLEGRTCNAIESIQNPIVANLLGTTIASLHKILNNEMFAKNFLKSDLYRTIYGSFLHVS